MDYISSLIYHYLPSYHDDADYGFGNKYGLWQWIYWLTWPNSYEKVLVFAYVLMLIEQILLVRKRKHLSNMKETLSSLNHGILYESVRLFAPLWEVPVYSFFYNNIGLSFLNSLIDNYPWMGWSIAIIATDFLYYWIHYLKHRYHILWAAHQVHHSSEILELTVGLRQSVIELFYDFLFYLPFVLVLHPNRIIQCRQFIYIYQLLLHTKLIGNLGIIEWIFVTPTHHGLHHGVNNYCMDKNYGGVLIIWDRLFSTFVNYEGRWGLFYGLPTSPKYYNTIYQQLIGFHKLYEKTSGSGSYRYGRFYIAFSSPWWNLLYYEIRRGGYYLIGVHSRRPQCEKNIKYETLFSFHYICNAHYFLLLNGLELYSVIINNADYMRIIRAFENLFFSLCSYNFIYDNFNTEGIIVNFIRSCILYYYYYDYPQWSKHVYTTIFFYDLLYLLIAIIENVIYYRNEIKKD